MQPFDQLLQERLIVMTQNTAIITLLMSLTLSISYIKECCLSSQCQGMMGLRKPQQDLGAWTRALSRFSKICHCFEAYGACKSPGQPGGATHPLPPLPCPDPNPVVDPPPLCVPLPPAGPAPVSPLPGLDSFGMSFDSW